jgi:hypothetical protein
MNINIYNVPKYSMVDKTYAVARIACLFYAIVWGVTSSGVAKFFDALNELSQ